MGRSYGIDDPVAAALDVLGRRWALLVVGELLRGHGPRRFGELRLALGEISNHALAHRLRELIEANVVRETHTGPLLTIPAYELTERGRAVAPVLHAFATWSAHVAQHADQAVTARV